MSSVSVLPGSPGAGAPESAPVHSTRSVRLGVRETLDLDEVWRVRSLLWAAEPPGALCLDFAGVRALRADAVFLLAQELSDAAARGVLVAVERLAPRLRRALQRHPLLRFAGEEDDLFTDPDLDAVGFRPSRH